MNFSNRFKIWWWGILLFILTIIAGWRLAINSFTNVDIFIFTFWFILVLFPIISEVSIFGINIKKDLEDFKNEIKGHILDIKNHINFQPIINVTTVPANEKEYKQKAIEEIKEDVKIEEQKLTEKKPKRFSISEGKYQKATSSEKMQDRLKKIAIIEKLIEDIFKALGENYKSQIKITDSDSKKDIIVDGVIYRGVAIGEIIEIKFITKMSFENFFYIAWRYIKKISKFGLRIPIRFIIVSEDLDEKSVNLIKEQVEKLNSSIELNPALPRASLQLFLFKDNVLNEMK
ncbi:hypothetical protein KAU40_02365 [Candidatus Parcubacteria bacterium]|nr:hypothetical protein [Candidatus Parcubacteria bacterium]